MLLSALCVTGLVGLSDVARGQCSGNEFAKLLDSDGETGNQFGMSTSISDDWVLVGAWFDGDQGFHNGSATIFRFDGETFIPQAKLLASDIGAEDRFGRSVSVSDEFAIVGAFGVDGETGAVYVFRFDGTSWTQQAKLLSRDHNFFDHFGHVVAISGNAFITGARLNDDNGRQSGSAYVFRFDGTNFNQIAKLLSFNGAAGDAFGVSVSIHGDIAGVGAALEDDKGRNSGSAFVYRGLTADCNDNHTIDLCDIANNTSEDCNLNAIPDECDIFGGTSHDDNQDGMPDECECTGAETIKKADCVQKNRRNKLIVKLVKGPQVGSFTVDLSTGQSETGTIGDNGKGKAKFKNVPSGDGTATATWGCGATQSKNYSCP